MAMIMKTAQPVAIKASRRSTVVVQARRTVKGTSSRAAVAPPAGTWFPGAEAPEWLPADLPGNRGFDPLGLAKDPESLQRFKEAEVFHCRIALLGALGALTVELTGQGNWWDATQWAVTGGKPQYLGVETPVQDVPTLIAIATGSFAFVESQRAAEPDADKRIYPGGQYFNPAGLGEGSDEERDKLRTNEIKNGRMAMVACLGLFAQHAATGKGAFEALSQHLSNPTAFNFTTNGVSIPGN